MSELEKNYLTISKTGAHEQIIKKSRFICSITRTTTIDDAQNFIKKVSDRYRDANHNTFAYTIGLNDEIVKANDNGEPSGTAGIPELKALQLMKLKNVTCVVTRFFGGIKLGSGGLIRAYSNSVTSCVEKIGVVKCILQQELIIDISYKSLNKVEYYLAQNSIYIQNKEFLATIKISIFITNENVKKVKSDLINLTSNNINFKFGKTRFNEFPITDFNYHDQ